MSGVVKRKLHSERGASMLMALVFFLVCGFVGAVIVGSATTNAQKYQGFRAQQQAYDSVSSAARLVRDTLEGLTLQGQEHWTEYTCNKNVSAYPGLDPAAHSDERKLDFFQGAARYDEKIAAIVLEGAEQVYKSQTVYVEKVPFKGWTKTFTIDDGACPVEVTATIQENYQLVFTFHPEERSLRDRYGMMLVCSAQATDTQETPETSCSHTYEVWSSTKYGSEPVRKDFPIYTHTRTTAIVWERGTILKGETRNADAVQSTPAA